MFIIKHHLAHLLGNNNLTSLTINVDQGISSKPYTLQSKKQCQRIRAHLFEILRQTLWLPNQSPSSPIPSILPFEQNLKYVQFFRRLQTQNLNQESAIYKKCIAKRKGERVYWSGAENPHTPVPYGLTIIVSLLYWHISKTTFQISLRINREGGSLWYPEKIKPRIHSKLREKEPLKSN